MNAAHLIQNGIVAVIGLAAMIYTLGRYMPGLRARVLNTLTDRLAASQTPWMQRLALRLRPIKNAGGCGDGCSSCGGCGTPKPAPQNAKPGSIKEQILEFHPRPH